MERAFIATKESKYVQDYDKVMDLAKQQRKFVAAFLKEIGAEATRFYLHGNGMVGVPFKEYEKSDIILSIIPTDNDLIKFGKILSKPDQHDLCSFRRNSKIGKEFAQKCVDEEIIINLHHLDFRDYFESLGFAAYSMQQFKQDENFYIKLISEYLKEDDTPVGFTEIKISEFYRIKEEYEKENGGN
jgi:hypothetical protein